MLLAQKLLETEAQLYEVKTQMSSLRKARDAAEEDFKNSEHALKRTNQPTVYLVTKLRDEEAAHALSKAQMVALQDRLGKSAKDKQSILKDNENIRERMRLMLHQRAEIDQLRGLLETLQAPDNQDGSPVHVGMVSAALHSQTAEAMGMGLHPQALEALDESAFSVPAETSVDSPLSKAHSGAGPSSGPLPTSSSSAEVEREDVSSSPTTQKRGGLSRMAINKSNKPAELTINTNTVPSSQSPTPTAAHSMHSTNVTTQARGGTGTGGTSMLSPEQITKMTSPTSASTGGAAEGAGGSGKKGGRWHQREEI